MSHDLSADIRRMRAVIGVLDEDLATADRLFNAPLARAELPPNAWERAEVARRQLEERVTAAEHAAADASRRAEDWQQKAVLAIGRGDAALARQAIERADEAKEEVAALTLECAELRVFLTEWAVRITKAPPATSTKPLANER
jgi:hypothetical protein